MTTATVLRSEWTKITTLRSLWTTPLVALLLTVGASVAVGIALGDKDASLYEDPSVGIYYGLNFGQAALACFGILLFGQEFNSRMITVSLTAVPRRDLLYAGKLAVGALVALAVGLVSTGACLVGYARTGIGDWQDPALTRSTVSGVLYQVLLVVVCFGLTAMIGNLTAAMGFVVPTVFLISPLLSGVPGVRTVVQFLPDQAGQYALRYADNPKIAYGHWTGLLIMATWAGLAAYGGLRAVRRREGAQ